MTRRRSPVKNVDASTFVQWLDNYREYVIDLDDVRRVYIHGVWVDPVLKRELRRYRNHRVRTIRPTTVERILKQLNFNIEEYRNGNP